MSIFKKNRPEKNPEEFEKTTRTLAGTSGRIVAALAIITGIYSLATLTIYPIDPWIGRSLHLGFMSALIFLIFKARGSFSETKVSWFDWPFALMSLLPSVYMIMNLEPLQQRVGTGATGPDIIVATLLLLLLLEITRRSTGLALPIIGIVFIVYALLGDYFPSWLWNPGYSFDRIVSTLMSTDGIYGNTLGVSATYVIMFVIFGAFLEVSGAGKFFIDTAFSFAGSLRGGPAKVAVVASSLMGTISGSAVGNVVTTGAFTIPLMKRVGYAPHFAGAVEAVASTGGQILPPVMGAAAFIMADILGITYGSIVIAALIPALLYYLAVFVMVDREALKLGLVGLPKSELPMLSEVLKKGFMFLIPVAVIIVTLVVLNFSPIKAGIWGIFSTVLVSWLSKEHRMGPTKILRALEKGAKDTAAIAAATGAAGIVVGVMGLTGLGGKLGNFIVSVGSINSLFALLMTMFLCLLLGMGLPTVAAYSIAAATVGPALVRLGFEPLVAQMFIFYFACISTITPPVALSAYAGAAIAGANPMKVGWTAVKLGILAFIVPFMFVFGPELLMQGEWYNILLAAAGAVIGTFAMGCGIQGWLFSKTSLWERLFLIAGSLMLIKPGPITDTVGILLLAPVVFFNFRKGRTAPGPGTPLQQDTV